MSKFLSFLVIAPHCAVFCFYVDWTVSVTIRKLGPDLKKILGKILSFA